MEAQSQKRDIISRYFRAVWRILKENRAILLFILLIYLGALVKGYYIAVHGNYFDQSVANYEESLITRWHERLIPFVSGFTYGSAWPGFFIPTTVYALLAFYWGLVSFGLLPIFFVWHSGETVGASLGLAVLQFQDLPGIEPSGIIFALILPQSIFAISGLVIGWALAFREGFAWIIPLQGKTRWQSVGKLARDWLIAVPVIVLLLYSAAFWANLINPLLLDRYIVGVGQGEDGAWEYRKGEHFTCQQLAWSPTGDSILIVDTDGNFIVWKFKHSAPDVLAIAMRPMPMSVSWSPSGDRIAYAAGGKLQLFSVATGEIEVIEGHEPKARCRAASWSPNGDVIAVIAVDSSIEKRYWPNLWTVNIENREWTQITNLDRYEGIRTTVKPTWSPDGSEIAFVRNFYKTVYDSDNNAIGRENKESIWIVGIDGDNLRKVRETGELFDAVAWSPDGKWLAFVARPDEEVDLDNFVPGNYVGSLSFIRPDGSELISDAFRADHFSPVSWSPDGKRIAFVRIMSCIIGEPELDNSEQN